MNLNKYFNKKTDIIHLHAHESLFVGVGSDVEINNIFEDERVHSSAKEFQKSNLLRAIEVFDDKLIFITRNGDNSLDGILSFKTEQSISNFIDSSLAYNSPVKIYDFSSDDLSSDFISKRTSYGWMKYEDNIFVGTRPCGFSQTLKEFKELPNTLYVVRNEFPDLVKIVVDVGDTVKSYQQSFIFSDHIFMDKFLERLNDPFVLREPLTRCAELRENNTSCMGKLFIKEYVSRVSPNKLFDDDNL